MELLYLYKPKIQNDTVFFSWEFSYNQDIFKKTEFFIQYEGIDLSKIPEIDFVELFVSLMIPILKAYKKEILIIVPNEISQETVNFWLNYNEADNVKVFPTVKSKLVTKTKMNSMEKSKIGILFGGGKDSLYAYNLNKEIFGPENLVLISYTFPINFANKNKLDQRRDNFALNKIKEDGVKIQKVITDFRSIFSTYSYFNTTHTQLYFTMSFPLYVEYGISFLTYSYEFTEYYNFDSEGNQLYHFKKSRPEFDSYLSGYFSGRFNNSLKVYNSNYYLSENMAFKILNDRYNALDNLMMCESIVDPKVKWCTKCNKCGEYVLYSLANKYESEEIDFSNFLIESDFIKKTITETEKRVRTNLDGNVIWYDGLISPIHYMSFCHVIYSIDLEYWSERLEPEAIENIKILKSWFGNKKYEILDKYLLEAVQQLELPFKDKVIEILDEYIDSNDSEILEITSGNSNVIIDYRKPYNIQTYNRNDITNSRVSDELLKLKKDSIIHAFNAECQAYNEETKEPIKYKFVEEYRGDTLYIDKSAPKKGDTVEVMFTLKNLIINKAYHLDLELLSPYFSNQYKNLFKYQLYFNEQLILEEDVADWGNENKINLYINSKKDSQIITIKIKALKNCEPWNWGKAAQLIFKKMKLNQCSNIVNNHVSVSSPYTKLFEWSND